MKRKNVKLEQDLRTALRGFGYVIERTDNYIDIIDPHNDKYFRITKAGRKYKLSRSVDITVQVNRLPEPDAIYETHNVYKLIKILTFDELIYGQKSSPYSTNKLWSGFAPREERE